MKNYRNFIGHTEFYITNTICCTLIVTCIMTLISHFSIIYNLRFLFHKCNNISHLDVILVVSLLTVTFFSFQNQLYSLHNLLLYSLHNIRKEYTHLFLLIKNFLDCLHTHLFFFYWRFNVSINNVRHFT